MQTGQRLGLSKVARVNPDAKALFAQLSESMSEDFLPVGLICIGDDNKTSFLYTPLVANDLMVASLRLRLSRSGPLSASFNNQGSAWHASS